jgi:hypothetical protein
VSDWPLLELPADAAEGVLVALCWEYFERAYLRDAQGNPVVVRDWRGTVVKMSRFAFDHIVTGHEDYRDGLGLHDVAFARGRAERLSWIGLTLAGDAVIEVRHQEVRASRGRRRKRRVLIVTEDSYVVVLDREDDGCLRLRTAFPADASYLTRIRREGAEIEVHRPVRE